MRSLIMVDVHTEKEDARPKLRPQSSKDPLTKS